MRANAVCRCWTWLRVGNAFLVLVYNYFALISTKWGSRTLAFHRWLNTMTALVGQRKRWMKYQRRLFISGDAQVRFIDRIDEDIKPLFRTFAIVFSHQAPALTVTLYTRMSHTHANCWLCQHLMGASHQSMLLSIAFAGIFKSTRSNMSDTHLMITANCKTLKLMWASAVVVKIKVIIETAHYQYPDEYKVRVVLVHILRHNWVWAARPTQPNTQPK